MAENTEAQNIEEQRKALEAERKKLEAEKKAFEKQKAQAAQSATQQPLQGQEGESDTAEKLDQTVQGGRYIVGGQEVDANGQPIKAKKQDNA